MLEEKVLRLNVPAVCCCGHTYPGHNGSLSVMCIALVAAAKSVPGHSPSSLQLSCKDS